MQWKRELLIAGVFFFVNICNQFTKWTALSKSNAMSFLSFLKVVIITDLGPRQDQHKILKIQRILLKLNRCHLYVNFHK